MSNRKREYEELVKNAVFYAEREQEYGQHRARSLARGQWEFIHIRGVKGLWLGLDDSTILIADGHFHWASKDNYDIVQGVDQLLSNSVAYEGVKRQLTAFIDTQKLHRR
ncbi:MAG: hypothetical protein LBS90_04910 [Oscillospiraceae bacterium]|jgi:hypothetical protein|nr:hypothetical protein [Oscillospiraceae bacterium]